MKRKNTLIIVTKKLIKLFQVPRVKIRCCFSVSFSDEIIAAYTMYSIHV